VPEIYLIKGQLLKKDTFSGSLSAPLYTGLTVVLDYKLFGGSEIDFDE
jgi:hypothetical protein